MPAPEKLGPPRHPPSSTGASAAVGMASFPLRRSAPRKRSADLLPPSPASGCAPPEKLRLGGPLEVKLKNGERMQEIVPLALTKRAAEKR